MIFNTQPITRLALLITVFIKSALKLNLLDYYFLGLTYIIVYVGAIAILFLFVIMMADTSPKGSEGSGSKIITPLIFNYNQSNIKLKIPYSTKTL